MSQRAPETPTLQEEDFLFFSPGVISAGGPGVEDGGAGPLGHYGGCAGLVTSGGRHEARARAEAGHVPGDYRGPGAQT